MMRIHSSNLVPADRLGPDGSLADDVPPLTTRRAIDAVAPVAVTQ